MPAEDRCRLILPRRRRHCARHWRRPYVRLQEYHIVEPEAAPVIKRKLATRKHGGCDGQHCKSRAELGFYRWAGLGGLGWVGWGGWAGPPGRRGQDRLAAVQVGWAGWAGLRGGLRVRPSRPGAERKVCACPPTSTTCQPTRLPRSVEKEGFTTHCSCLRRNTECDERCACHNTRERAAPGASFLSAARSVAVLGCAQSVQGRERSPSTLPRSLHRRRTGLLCPLCACVHPPQRAA